MNLAKRKGEGKGKKEAKGAQCTDNICPDQITLDRESILATMQDRVRIHTFFFQTLDPTSPEVVMPGS